MAVPGGTVRRPHQHLPRHARVFRGVAALWWRSFASSLRDIDRPDILVCQWPAFQQACLAQFRPVNAARVAREKLMVLTQSTSVANYAHRFRTLLLNIPDLSEADRLFLFTRGLKRDVAAMVQLSNPATWEAAAVTAENVDAVLFEGQRTNTTWTPRNQRPPSQNRPTYTPG